MIVKPVDLETSIFNNGNAFDPRNVVCFIGVGDKIWDIEYYQDSAYGNKLHEAQKEIDEADLLVFVNGKFDMHWLTKYGIGFSHKRVWDCQLVHFMLLGQTTPYPSMNSMAEYYSLAMKPDIKERYWNEGIDTREIPYEEISDYLQHHDLPTTLKIYEIQVELVKSRGKNFERLVSLCNQDLLVLQDIEYNGLAFDENACIEEAIILEKDIDKLKKEFYKFHNIPEFNTESGDHLSCLLYGGIITIPRKELIGVYKTGEKKGLDKYGWIEYTYEMPQLIQPLKGSELKKEGYYATGEDVLKSLKPRGDAKRVIEIILKLAKLEKSVGTYYRGLPKLRGTMNWKYGMLHGNLNQCVARTGRLSSSKPNLQNLDSKMKKVFKTRFNLEKESNNEK